MPTNLQKTIDALGDIEAEIKELEKKKKELRISLDELENGGYDGIRYHLNIKTQSRGTLDQDAVRAVLSEQWVEEHTKTTSYQILRFSARNGETGK